MQEHLKDDAEWNWWKKMKERIMNEARKLAENYCEKMVKDAASSEHFKKTMAALTNSDTCPAICNELKGFLGKHVDNHLAKGLVVAGVDKYCNPLCEKYRGELVKQGNSAEAFLNSLCDKIDPNSL